MRKKHPSPSKKSLHGNFFENTASGQKPTTVRFFRIFLTMIFRKTVETVEIFAQLIFFAACGFCVQLIFDRKQINVLAVPHTGIDPPRAKHPTRSAGRNSGRRA